MLKDCNEMTRDVLARRDAYEKAKKRRLRAAAGCTAALLLCCGAIFTLAPKQPAQKLPEAEAAATPVPTASPVLQAPEYEISLFVNEADTGAGGVLRADVDIRAVPIADAENIRELQFIKNLALPEALTQTRVQATYIRANREIPVYDDLYEYVCFFSSEDTAKELRVAFSTKGKPIRDYLFCDDGAKTSCIEGVGMTVFRYQNILYAGFSIGETFFDAESVGLSDEEFARSIAEIIRQFA